jgi:hypothetical protein
MKHRSILKASLGLIIVLFWGSCKTYVLSVDSFKSQFLSDKEKSALQKDSTFAKLHPIKSLDSIRCKRKSGAEEKVNIRQNHKIVVMYLKGNKFWENNRRVVLNPNKIVYNDSGIVSEALFVSGMFQTDSGKFIPFNKITEIRIRNFSDQDSKIFFKLSLLPLVNPYDGYSVRAGGEFKLTGNTSLALEGGGYFSYTNSGLGSGTSGVIINPEFRYYLNRNKETVGRYIALGYAYKDQTYNWADTIALVQGSSVNKYFRDYEVHKISNTADLKYGGLRVFDTHWVVDWFFGLGIVFKNTSSSLSDAEQKSIVSYGDFGGYESYKNEVGKIIAPAFTAGIKIGWRIK